MGKKTFSTKGGALRELVGSFLKILFWVLVILVAYRLIELFIKMWKQWL